MPRLLPALLWPVLTLGLLLFPPQIHAADPWQGKVVGVVDGATLDVAKSDGQVERVRLFAIGVPAPGQAEADAAQRRTESWCRQWGEVAEVRPMGHDRGGRVVARVIVGREDMAEVLAKGNSNANSENKGLWAQ